MRNDAAASSILQRKAPASGAKSIAEKPRSPIKLATEHTNAVMKIALIAQRLTSDYTGLDNIPFWGVIQTPRLRRGQASFHQWHLYCAGMPL
jgi:hypothetical protein